MERPKREDFDKICRLCLKSASLVNIFDRNPRTQQESLSTLVRETVGMLGLTIELTDPYPKKVCRECKGVLRTIHKFRQNVQEANDMLLEVVSDRGGAAESDHEMEHSSSKSPNNPPSSKDPTVPNPIKLKLPPAPKMELPPLPPFIIRTPPSPPVGYERGNMSKNSSKVKQGEKSTGITLIKCTECNLVYTDAKKLATHKREKHPELQEQDMCTCETCQKKFMRPANLKQHMRTHKNPPNTDDSLL